MKLTILGSGGEASFLKISNKSPRGLCSCLLQLGKEYILLDCGHGTLKTLVNINFPFQKIDYVFISHFHTDHIADLMPLIHGYLILNIYQPKRKRKKPLVIIGPRGIKKAYLAIRDIMWPHKNEHRYVPLTFKEVGQTCLGFKNFKIKILPTFHAPDLDNVSCKIIFKDKTLIYSGDLNSKMDKNSFTRFSRDADVLIIDTARPIGWSGGHLEPTEVGQIANQAHVKYLIPTHLTDIDSPAEIIKEIRKNYKGKITLAEDFLEINI